jgi:hypothetical protein
MMSFWHRLRPRSRAILLMSAGLLLLIVLLASFALWELGRVDSFGSGQDDLDAATIERLTGIALPADASGLRSHVESWQDTIVHLRFELPAAALPAWLAGLEWDKPLAAAPLAYPFDTPFEWVADKAWWQPQRATSFQAGTLHSALGLYQHILIDTSDPARTLIYVVSFDT